MALTGQILKEEEGTSNEKEVFVAKFTNGTLAQLRELSSFLKKEGVLNSDDPLDVVKVAISVLVGAKENKDKNTTESA